MNFSKLVLDSCFACFLSGLFSVLTFNDLVGADPASSGDQPWSQGVLTEEQRQNYISNRVANVSSEFSALIKDLRSNGLLEENGGEELQNAIDVLGKVKDSNIEQAIISLREAREQQKSARLHIAKADDEVEITVSDLTDLLRLSNALGSSQFLRQEIRRLLSHEEILWIDCKALGRAQLEGATIKPVDLVEAATTQSDLAALAAKLRPMFLEVAKGVTDLEERSLIKKAGILFVEGQVEILLASAAENITQGNLLGAVTPQKEAIDVLLAIDRLLGEGETDGMGDLYRMIAALQEILRKQRDLRKLTETAPQAEFASRQRQWQSLQRDLRSELARIDTKPFAPVGVDADAGRTNPLLDAGEAMEQAEDTLGASQQKAAIGHQLNAEAELERAIAMLQKKIDEKQKPNSGKADPVEAMIKFAGLLKQLEEDQRALRKETQGMAANKQEVNSRAAPQDQLIERIILLGQMPEAEPATIKRTLRKAYSAMEEALSALKKNDSVVAVPAQIRAEEALAEARAAAEAEAKKLKEEAKKDAALDAVQKLAQQLLAEQKKLAALTEEATPEQVPQQAPEQSALAQKAQEAAAQVPSEASPDLAKASEAMKAAAEAMKQGDKEQAKSEQAKAAEALKSAAQKAASAKSKKSKSAKSKPGENKDEGKRGGKQKGKGKSKGAKGDGKDGDGEGEGGSPKPGSPAPPTPPKLAPVKLTGKNIDAKGQERYFAKAEASGDRSDDTTSDWKVLGEREQDEMTERYIQKLPVEYRALLKDYYQAIATDE
ncbi:MAG: hypothetical protein O3A82_02455 [Verrucomicrobia bacterium]|nr:hypothetical protein [Verrucomicrobiota bacterium]